MNHDIVAIGASAGGIEVLRDVVANLPADLAASVFVVVHLPSGHASVLPELLSRRGALPAIHPVHDERIEPGKIYVAPPDNHLQLRPGLIEVVRGPKDNGHRPAVDVLFRTAAAAYGARVIGVVLSGYQDCGTAGMMSIKARGGVGVVQDPATAIAPDMPRHVIERVAVDHVVHPLELPALLTRLVAAPAGPTAEPTPLVRQLEGSELGHRADIVCPVCEGVLTETQPGVFQHFRCHVGHAFTLDGLLREQSEELERVLWAAVRALEESAALAHRLTQHETGELRARFAEKERTHRQQADYLRQLLLRGRLLTPVDAQAS
ncbi:MAG: chemotaxis protein CheB [Deltaproteobacteria bacterium]|nr:MAG: chemotaxis protein CheB [Deltaproteobacteria bacterium]